VAVRVPDVDVYAEAGGSAPEPDFYAPEILARFQLEIADIGDLNSADEFVESLLLLAQGARRP
jgi:hypothetical protein